VKETLHCCQKNTQRQRETARKLISDPCSFYTFAHVSYNTSLNIADQPIQTRNYLIDQLLIFCHKSVALFVKIPAHGISYFPICHALQGITLTYPDHL